MSCITSTRCFHVEKCDSPHDAFYQCSFQNVAHKSGRHTCGFFDELIWYAVAYHLCFWMVCHKYYTYGPTTENVRCFVTGAAIVSLRMCKMNRKRIFCSVSVIGDQIYELKQVNKSVLDERMAHSSNGVLPEQNLSRTVGYYLELNINWTDLEFPMFISGYTMLSLRNSKPAIPPICLYNHKDLQEQVLPISLPNSTVLT